ncbi:MAG: glycosyltransferase family 4 protein [Coleofasciculus sp. G3-WIS-01]|uniref:glycosyltransferase family 4 protein n=1 Tax=Coleofasciculus sp. G3-WIS-01 TaxID=3069528 RepID=UPI0032FD26F2
MGKSVVIISQYFYPSLASTAQLMTDLAKGLAARGYQLKVFTSSSAEKNTTNDALLEVEVSRSFSLSQQNPSILYKAANSLLFLVSSLIYVTFKVHRSTPILITSNPPYSGVIGIYFSSIKKGKFYFILQDIFPESAVLCRILEPHSILFKLFSFLSYLTFKYSNSMVTLSQSMKEFLEKKHFKLEQKKKIRIIENWSIEAIPICEKQENEFARRYGLTETFTVLYAGNMGRLHDIESLANTAYMLSNQPIQFIFIGNGFKRSMLENYVCNYKLTNVLLLPFQPREMIPLSLTACDVSLVSLIEGAEEIIAPCKLYGMLAAGRAILSISSTGSYIEQLLNDYSCGINCPPHNPQQLADTIAKLAADPERVTAMGKRARQLYEEKYTFSRALDEYEKLLFNTELLN